MPTKQDYDMALRQMDSPTRVGILYLERLINEKFSASLRAQQPVPPKVDLSKIESTLDSLQKQVDGLRPKIEAGYKLSQDHDEVEIYLKKLTKRADATIEAMNQFFKERYETGVYSEGEKRKIREDGLLLDLKREEEK